MKSNLKYDGTTLQGTLNGIPVTITRHIDDPEDLEKACMMAILKHLGYTYADIQELQRNVKQKWIPKYKEKYYYISDTLEVKTTDNYAYDVDIIRIGTRNCFKSNKDAQKKLKEIKEIMQNDD